MRRFRSQAPTRAMAPFWFSRKSSAAKTLLGPGRQDRVRGLEQFSVQRDHRAGERLLDRAILLRVLRLLREAVRIDTRDFRLGPQLDARDGEATAALLEMHLRRGGDALRCEAGLTQSRRQRHREAARVRATNQLLGIRALAILETRWKRVASFERAAPELDVPLPITQAALPYRFRLAHRHDAHSSISSEPGILTLTTAARQHERFSDLVGELRGSW